MDAITIATPSTVTRTRDQRRLGGAGTATERLRAEEKKTLPIDRTVDQECHALPARSRALCVAPRLLLSPMFWAGGVRLFPVELAWSDLIRAAPFILACFTLLVVGAHIQGAGWTEADIAALIFVETPIRCWTFNPFL